MSRLYIIVQTNKSSYNDQTKVTQNSEREVLRYVGQVSSHDALEDDIHINRIFSVDDYGNVLHHEIEFKNGKLFLVTIPIEN
ncbi:hypothetical protein [Paenibacillus bouchesdurhonensis]|uniref:hypothetical protein n=1 Tax=Paenibacillus bouchesdurhonensis TaxID=1870990 RepID=UPI000DA6260D|nr:hypothetical protein [Paenibacillus bouchesdurhonensis]